MDQYFSVSNYTSMERIKFVDSSVKAALKSKERYEQLNKLLSDMPETLKLYELPLIQLLQSLQYNPAQNTSNLFLATSNGNYCQIASVKDFITYFAKYYQFVINPSPYIYSPFFNTSSIDRSLSQHTDWLEKILSLLLKIRKADYKATQNFLRYHKLIDEKKQKAYNEIYYKFGWPLGFGNISPSSENDYPVVLFENNLYILPSKEPARLLTPELIKQLWAQRNVNLSNKDCSVIWNYFKKFCIPTESVALSSYSPLCTFYSDNNFEIFELKYSVRFKKWSVQIHPSPNERDTLFLLNQATLNNHIRKEETVSYLFDFCGKSQSGLSFWSHYITDQISRTEKPALYILYLNHDKEQEIILKHLACLQIEPNLINELSDLEKLLICGMTPDIITAVPYFAPNRTTTELIQNLLTCKTIEIPTFMNSIKLKYKSKTSVLIFCRDDKSPDDLKLFCKIRKIHVFEASWTGFSTNAKLNLDPLLSDNSYHGVSKDLTVLEANEIAYVQWVLFLAKYHTAKQILPQKLTPEEVLTRFLDKFCIVTGKREDCFPSQDFYNQWVLDYYDQNNCAPIGYKRFNRFLRSYEDGQLCVKAIHKSTGNNVQHIIGLQFLKNEYEKRKSERASKNIKIYQNFYTRLDNLFDITGKEVQAIVQSITEYRASKET